MEEVLFTQFKDVEAYAKNYYEKHHHYLDFDTILQHLYQEGKLTSTPIVFRRSANTLSDSEFCEHALEQVIDASRVLSNRDTKDVYESFGLFFEKDIYTMLTVPFIHMENHIHDYYEILYLCQGSCTYYFQDTPLSLHKGQFLILSPNTVHRIDMAQNGFGLSINIRKSTFQNTFQTLLNEHNLLSDFFAHTFYDTESSNYITFDIENTPEYNYLIQQIFDESNCTENHSNMICVSLLNLFFGKLLQDFGKTIHLYSDVNNATYNRTFPLMLKYVQSNYQTITLPMMSQIFHYNESYISLLFKKYLHENFSNVVQNLRLEEAKKLLESTDYNLEKISEMVGYNSVDHFSRIFKRKYSMAPSKYRKMHKGADR